jgi:putative acetyltransferase
VPISIRPERPGDAPQVRDIHDVAFGGPLEGQIVDGIRGTDRWIPGGSLVAELDGTVVGHVLLSEGDLVADDGSARRIWVVGPLGVIPARQGRGVGSALMRSAIALAVERGQPVLALLGHAGYYRRFGFGSARALGLAPPQPWPDEHWLALPLPGWNNSIRGTVHYPAAFGAP